MRTVTNLATKVSDFDIAYYWRGVRRNGKIKIAANPCKKNVAFNQHIND
jgi:hypothetical protein